MKLFLNIFLLLSAPFVFGQISVDRTTYDFGDIYANQDTYVDFVFKNETEKEHYLLRINKPRDVYYLFSAKFIQPDSTIIIRFKINDQIKGKFDHEVEVYFSANPDPIKIRLTGNVKQINNNPMTACPDFNSTPNVTAQTSFQLVVKVIDSLTTEPIKNSKVYIVEKGELVGTYRTNNKGVVVVTIPLGLYYITAHHDDYDKDDYFDGYVNATRNFVLLELQRGAEPVEIPEEIVVVNEEPEIIEEIPEEIVIQIEEEEPEVIEETIQEPIEESLPDPVVVEDIAIDPTPLEELPDTLFDDKHFKHTNITFILDVSSSMVSNGKLELLRMSMIELTKILRPNDMVSIIKYSTETEVILKNTSGDEKDLIINTVKELRASGMTAGGTAIKLGYKINKKSHINNGNNIVIMITDGAFNRGDKDYLKTIESNYLDKGVRFSVVGIKMSEYLTAHMQGIASKGGGAFVQIRNIEEAQTKLIQEIRRTAFKLG